VANDSGIRIEGLAQFRADLRRAQGSYPRQLATGVKAAGEPIIRYAGSITARRSGRLAGSWRASVRGVQGNITSTAAYGGGAVWGLRGKWAGFAKYGGTPRFVGEAIDVEADAVAEILFEHLRELVTIEGWAV
jgi:hypothetical protein